MVRYESLEITHLERVANAQSKKVLIDSVVAYVRDCLLRVHDVNKTPRKLGCGVIHEWQKLAAVRYDDGEIGMARQFTMRSTEATGDTTLPKWPRWDAQNLASWTARIGEGELQVAA